MSRIDELIAQLCPAGVPHARIADALSVVTTPRGVKRSDYSAGTRIAIVDQGRELVAGYTDDDTIKIPEGRYVVFGDHTRAVKWVDFPFAVGADGTKVLQAGDGLLPKFAYYAMGNLEIPDRGYNRHWTVVRDLRIPVPPEEVQCEIIRILDQFTRLEADMESQLESELEARRHQFVHYRSELLHFGAETPLSPLSNLAKNLDSLRRPVTKPARTKGEIPYYGASGVVDYVSDHIFDGDYLLVSEDGANLLARSAPIAFSISGKTWVNNHAHVLEFETHAERRFVEIYLNSIDLSPYVSGAAQPKLNKVNLNRIVVPNPPIAEKQRVVALLEKFEALVDGLRSDLSAEITARRKQYEYYRGRLLTFKEAEA